MRTNMAAAWARVAVRSGAKVVSVSPLVMPISYATAMYPFLSDTSVNGRLFSFSASAAQDFRPSARTSISAISARVAGLLGRNASDCPITSWAAAQAMALRYCEERFFGSAMAAVMEAAVSSSDGVCHPIIRVSTTTNCARVMASE